MFDYYEGCEDAWAGRAKQPGRSKRYAEGYQDFLWYTLFPHDANLETGE
jgi:hypothetical protein